jgi:hypothetical protein
MLQITILPGKPHVNEGKAKATGLPYRIVEQAAFAVWPDGTAAAFSVQPPRDAEPYKPGTYALDAASLFVRDGKLQLAPKLVAVVGGTK